MVTYSGMRLLVLYIVWRPGPYRSCKIALQDGIWGAKLRFEQMKPHMGRFGVFAGESRDVVISIVIVI